MPPYQDAFSTDIHTGHAIVQPNGGIGIILTYGIFEITPEWVQKHWVEFTPPAGIKCPDAFIVVLTTHGRKCAPEGSLIDGKMK